MKNYVQLGHTLTLTAPYDVVSGAGALIGSIFGVAAAAIANGVKGEFQTVGVFALAKATGAAWSEGDLIYWDNTAKNCTKTSSGNTKIGVAVNQADSAAMPASGDTTGTVRLNGSF